MDPGGSEVAWMLWDIQQELARLRAAQEVLARVRYELEFERRWLRGIEAEFGRQMSEVRSRMRSRSTRR